MIRRVILAVALPIAFGYAWGVAFVGCGTLSSTEQVSVAQDGTQLATCAAGAHLCKLMERTSNPDASLAPCWAEFDECMSAHGFTDAGADAKGGR